MHRTNRNLGLDEAASWSQRPGPGASRRRALFEGEDGAEAFAVSRVLDKMDIETMWCPGPDGRHGPHCPLVEKGHCELLDKADFVINNLGTDNAHRAAVAEAVEGTVHGDKPVAVVTTRREAESLRAELPNCTVVEGPLTRRIVTDIAQVEPSPTTLEQLFTSIGARESS